MRCRDIYLRIEKLPAYSPVSPEGGEHGKYGRDCMRNHGHEDGYIPAAEIVRRQVDAVVYREYLDAGYTVPNTTPCSWPAADAESAAVRTTTSATSVLTARCTSGSW